MMGRREIKFWLRQKKGKYIKNNERIGMNSEVASLKCQ